MPEGPEVRKTADWLKSNIEGCIIRSIDFAGRFVKQPIERLTELQNKKCINVRCRGKVMVLDFEGDISAVSTLGMSGLWSRADGKHAALKLGCEWPPTRGIIPIYYIDQRRFGNFKVVDTREATSKLDELGWDPLQDPGGYGKIFARATKYVRRVTPICEVMLDQNVFAGVGNYIRAETMYRAKIDPWKSYRDIVYADTIRLCQTVATVMKESYARGGATLENFYDGDGNRGDQVDFLEIYGKTHDPHGNPVERKKDKNGRTVWYVPAVQT